MHLQHFQMHRYSGLSNNSFDCIVVRALTLLRSKRAKGVFNGRNERMPYVYVIHTLHTIRETRWFFSVEFLKSVWHRLQLISVQFLRCIDGKGWEASAEKCAQWSKRRKGLDSPKKMSAMRRREREKKGDENEQQKLWTENCVTVIGGHLLIN